MKSITTLAIGAALTLTTTLVSAQSQHIDFTDKNGSYVILRTDLIQRMQEFNPPGDGCYIQVGEKAFHAITKAECDRIKPLLRAAFSLPIPTKAQTKE